MVLMALWLLETLFKINDHTGFSLGRRLPCSAAACLEILAVSREGQNNSYFYVFFALKQFNTAEISLLTWPDLSSVPPMQAINLTLTGCNMMGRVLHLYIHTSIHTYIHLYITSHHITPHHSTAQHSTSHHITSHHITSHAYTLHAYIHICYVKGVAITSLLAFSCKYFFSRVEHTLALMSYIYCVITFYTYYVTMAYMFFLLLRHNVLHVF